MVDKEKIKKIFTDLEKIEGARGGFFKQIETDYPKPVKRQFLIYENFGMSIEEGYFWMKDMLADLGFIEMDKIVDTYNASEQSAFFGTAQQRLGMQQDKAASYLGIIGKMVKEMFQIVREIKLMEEKDELYKKAAAGDDGAEKALKGMWIDFVDNGPGGIKASSVYGLATQIGYSVLPDLFFAAPAALKLENVSEYVKKLDFNEKVKTVLVRKLEQYTAWRDATAKEIAAKMKFTIQYLRQHYNSIMLYVDWVKPYLRNIKRLGMNPETQLSTDIVGAFEGSVVEVEYLAKKPGGDDPDDPRACILMHFFYRTRPVMNPNQEYQRGPTHIGRMEMTLRGYVWTNDQIAQYKKLKQEEDFELLKSIDTSIEQSMDYLGEELKKYLSGYGERFGTEEEQIDLIAYSLVKSKQAADMEEGRKKAKKFIKEEKEKGKAPSLFEPFTSIGKGFTEVAKGFIPGKNISAEQRKKAEERREKKKDYEKDVKKAVVTAYTLYKKAHGIFTL